LKVVNELLELLTKEKLRGFLESLKPEEVDALGGVDKIATLGPKEKAAFEGLKKRLDSLFPKSNPNSKTENSAFGKCDAVLSSITEGLSVLLKDMKPVSDKHKILSDDKSFVCTLGPTLTSDDDESPDSEVLVVLQQDILFHPNSFFTLIDSELFDDDGSFRKESSTALPGTKLRFDRSGWVPAYPSKFSSYAHCRFHHSISDAADIMAMELIARISKEKNISVGGVTVNEVSEYWMNPENRKYLFQSHLPSFIPLYYIEHIIKKHSDSPEPESGLSAQIRKNLESRREKTIIQLTKTADAAAQNKTFRTQALHYASEIPRLLTTHRGITFCKTEKDLPNFFLPTCLPNSHCYIYFTVVYYAAAQDSPVSTSFAINLSNSTNVHASKTEVKNLSFFFNASTQGVTVLDKRPSKVAPQKKEPELFSSSTFDKDLIKNKVSISYVLEVDLQKGTAVLAHSEISRIARPIELKVASTDPAKKLLTEDMKFISFSALHGSVTFWDVEMLIRPKYEPEPKAKAPPHP